MGYLSSIERTSTMPNEERRQKTRGFASMSSEKQREIARKGGRAAHERGTAHEFTADEARAAGRKGGERVSANRSHMAAIGRLGGRSSAGRRAASSTTVTTDTSANPAA
jgi:general stress protein YciG